MPRKLHLGWIWWQECNFDDSTWPLRDQPRIFLFEEADSASAGQRRNDTHSSQLGQLRHPPQFWQASKRRASSTGSPHRPYTYRLHSAACSSPHHYLLFRNNKQDSIWRSWWIAISWSLGECRRILRSAQIMTKKVSTLTAILSFHKSTYYFKI